MEPNATERADDMPQINLGNAMGLIRWRNCKAQKQLAEMAKVPGCFQSSQMAKSPKGQE